MVVITPVLSRARESSCTHAVTPESLIEHQLGGRIPELFDFASCAELQAGKPLYCDAFPGGARSEFPGDKAPLRYKTPGTDGLVRPASEFLVCDSRSAGYLVLAGLARGAKRDELLPLVKRMLNNEKGLDEGKVLDAYRRVYDERKIDGPGLPEFVRLGFFNHLLGAEACQKAPFVRLRKECLAKAATLEALKAKDDRLCQKDDLMCAALIRGGSLCRASGEIAVRKFCRGDYEGAHPQWREWSLQAPAKL